MTERFIHRYPKSRSRKNIAVVFPNCYRLGMSNLGFHSVYNEVQNIPDVMCERVFFDQGTKSPVSVETGRGLGEFDLIFISVSFETDIINCVAMLEGAGIPISPDGRAKPYIITGGIAAVFASGYLMEFSDAVACGDAPLLVRPVVEAALESVDRDAFITALSGIDGIYTRSGGTDAVSYLRDSEWKYPAHTVILSDKTEFADRGLFEISRSCKYKCAFCLVSRAYGEYEALPMERVIETADYYQGLTDKLGMVAATSTNHPDFARIIEELNRRGFRLSFSAFRIEPLDDALLKAIIDNENKTLTVAPETVSPRLKKLIHKDIPEPLILDKIRAACMYGIKRLKLYFLIGLPGETMEDIDGIIRLVTEIHAVSSVNVKATGYQPEIIVDINPLVPKPLTELQGAPMESEKSLRKKTVYLKNRLRSLGRVFVYGESPRNSHLQYRISQGLMDFDEIVRLSRKGEGADI
ncbi:MAG: radical SAM protein [Brevinematales bacterium]|nr:radical SAM protein [Brevinematales bacterium]